MRGAGVEAVGAGGHRRPPAEPQLAGLAPGLVASHVGPGLGHEEGRGRREVRPDRRAGVALRGVLLESGPAQGAGHVEVEPDPLDEDPGPGALAEAKPAVGSQVQPPGLVVRAEPLPTGEARLHEAVEAVRAPAEAPRRARLAEAPRLERERPLPPGRAGGRGEVERAAEHGRAEAVARVTPEDLDRVGEARVEEPHHVGPVGPVEGQAVAQHAESALDRVLLEPRAPHVQLGLVVAPEEALGDDARHRPQRVGERDVGDALQVVRVEQRRAAGNRLEPATGLVLGVRGGLDEDRLGEAQLGPRRRRLGRGGRRSGKDRGKGQVNHENEFHFHDLDREQRSCHPGKRPRALRGRGTNVLATRCHLTKSGASRSGGAPLARTHRMRRSLRPAHSVRSLAG